MSEYNNDEQDIETPDGEETPENDNLDLEQEEETVEELKARLLKAEKIAENQRIRAEKAEKKGKTPKTEKETPKNDNYTLADIRALSDVHDDDVDRIVKFAKMEDISIAEAKKHEDMQAILANRAEARKVADATNTGGGKRGTNDTSGNALLKDFETTGKLPEKDEDYAKLAEARIARMKGKA